MNANKAAKNAVLMASRWATSPISNSPYNEDTKHQFFGSTTQEFFETNLKYASNRVLAEVQGLDYSDFYAYQKRYIRTSNVLIPSTGDKLSPDWQFVIVEGKGLNFLPRGAKIRFNGNTWLVVNTMNIQGVNASGVMTRCDAVWYRYDDDGETILAEPFHYGNGGAQLGSDNFVTHNSILMDSYQHAYMQYNEETKCLHHNQRIVCGTQVFTVQGLNDSYQEFTDDPDSIHLQHFDLHVTDVLDTDDMEKKIAGGLARPRHEEEIEPKPIEPETEGWTGIHVVWETEVPNELPRYSSVKLSASVYDGETKLNAIPTYKVTGAFKEAYSVENDGNGIEIKAYLESNVPLTVTAEYSGVSSTAQIKLVGW